MCILCHCSNSSQSCQSQRHCTFSASSFRLSHHFLSYGHILYKHLISALVLCPATHSRLLYTSIHEFKNCTVMGIQGRIQKCWSCGANVQQSLFEIMPAELPNLTLSVFSNILFSCTSNMPHYIQSFEGKGMWWMHSRGSLPCISGFSHIYTVTFKCHFILLSLPSNYTEVK